MRSIMLEKIEYAAIAVLIALAILQTTVNAQEADGVERTIEGVWRVTITPRNCVTGAPIPTAVFESLFTFHKDGTLSAWTQNNVITTTRTPSQGLWRNVHGWSDYTFNTIHLRYNLTTGAYVGRQESISTLVLGESGDDFVADGLATAFNVEGVPGTPGCSNSVGTRFKLEP